MEKIGYATTTYKLNLECKHRDWLEKTKDSFNEVLGFYYGLLIKHPELWELGGQKTMRELEILSVPVRNKEKPMEPIPVDLVPVYFRRAAISLAFGMFHSYLSKLKQWEKDQKGFKPQMASHFDASPLYYKGMYKDFEEKTVMLKLFTGSSWTWIKAKLRGRPIPKDGIKLSPTIVLTQKKVKLHVPVKVEVKDIRKARERIEAEEKVCGITFTNDDSFAVCTILTADGRTLGTQFIRGGKTYGHHSKRLTEKIKDNEKIMGKNHLPKDSNKKYKEHLYNLGEYWAHKVSKAIVDFCIEHEISLITMADFTDNPLLDYLVKKKGKHIPAYLSLKIRRYLQYKAFKAGIVISKVKPQYTANKCSTCGDYLIRQSPKDKTYRCKTGHTGNKALNTARNITQTCFHKFGLRSVAV